MKACIAYKPSDTWSQRTQLRWKKATGTTSFFMDLHGQACKGQMDSVWETFEDNFLAFSLTCLHGAETSSLREASIFLGKYESSCDAIPSLAFVPVAYLEDLSWILTWISPFLRLSADIYLTPYGWKGHGKGKGHRQPALKKDSQGNKVEILPKSHRNKVETS